MQTLSSLIFSLGGTACDPANVQANLCNALSSKGGTIDDVLFAVMSDVGKVIGVLAIAVIVYAGLRLAASNGDKNQIALGKRILTYGIVGLLVSVFAFAGVIAVANFIGVKNIDVQNIISNPSSQPLNLLGYGSLYDFVIGMTTNIMYIIGSVSLLMIIFNGFKYVTARGDSNQIDSAKKGLLWSIVGLILSILASTIVIAINNLTMNP